MVEEAILIFGDLLDEDLMKEIIHKDIIEGARTSGSKGDGVNAAPKPGRYGQQHQGKGTMETKKFIYYQEEDMFVGWLEAYPDYRTQGETGGGVSPGAYLKISIVLLIAPVDEASSRMSGYFFRYLSNHATHRPQASLAASGR